VISSAVLGFLILFNAREMCSSRRVRELGIFRISSSISRKMNLAYPDTVPMSAWVWKRMGTGMADHSFLAGSSLTTKFPIAAG
jgi:hypothetical protein